jgi:hypothetical protein
MRKSDFILLVFLLAVATGLHQIASAAEDDISNWQCDGGIVSYGDFQEDVRQKCGEPTSREQDGEVWIYGDGTEQLRYIITFAQGKVERIQTED